MVPFRAHVEQDGRNKQLRTRHCPRVVVSWTISLRVKHSNRHAGCRGTGAHHDSKPCGEAPTLQPEDSWKDLGLCPYYCRVFIAETPLFLLFWWLKSRDEYRSLVGAVAS